VEFAVGLPGRLKRRDRAGKRILREGIKGLVPDCVPEHPKRGFAVSLGKWFRGDLSHRRDTLASPGRRVCACVGPESALRLIRDHRIGRRDHSQLLWRVVVLDLGLTSFARGELAQPLRATSLQPA